MSELKYVVITPARDEEQFIRRTIDSMIAQTVRPLEWIIVDDGSMDNTAALVQAAAAQHPWIKLLRLPNRGSRKVGSGSVEAFNAGLRALSARDYRFLSCIDADIVLKPRYFEVILQKFSANPKLGNACGEIYENLGHRLVKLRSNREMTYGAIKCWRRACFEAFGGLVCDTSWDGIDCYQSMRMGWQTAKFEDEELQVLHLRAIGSSDRNIFRGWFRRGRSLYFLQAHPLWILASLVFHAPDRPFILGTLCMAAGYLKSWLTRRPRYDHAEFVRFLHGWQLRKLRSLAKIR